MAMTEGHTAPTESLAALRTALVPEAEGESCTPMLDGIREKWGRKVAEQGQQCGDAQSKLEDGEGQGRFELPDDLRAQFERDLAASIVGGSAVGGAPTGRAATGDAGEETATHSAPTKQQGDEETDELEAEIEQLEDATAAPPSSAVSGSVPVLPMVDNFVDEDFDPELDILEDRPPANPDPDPDANMVTEDGDS